MRIFEFPCVSDSCGEGHVASWPVAFCNCRRNLLFTTNESSFSTGYLKVRLSAEHFHINAGFEDDT